MNIVFGIALMLINCYYFNKGREKGYYVYCIFSVVSPVIHVFGLPLSYDILFLPLLILIEIVQKRGKIVNRETARRIVPLFLYIAWLAIVTLVSPYYGMNYRNVIVMPMIGMLRCLVVYYFLASCAVVAVKFREIVRAIVFINVASMLLEMLLIRIWSGSKVFQLWDTLYGKVGASGNLLQYTDFSQVQRLGGTFCSSAYLATLSVVGVTVFLIEYVETKTMLSLVSLGCSMFCGFGSSSKRFFLGAVAVVIGYALLSFLFNKSKKIRIKTHIILLVAFVTVVAVVLYFRLRGLVGIDYYIGFLKDWKFLHAFDSRFGADGATRGMMEIIKQHFILGIGCVNVYGINATDSELVITIFRSGLIGAGFYFVYFAKAFKRLWKMKDPTFMMMSIIVAFEFVISTEFYSTLGVLLMSCYTSKYIETEEEYDSIKKIRLMNRRLRFRNRSVL